MRSAYGVHGYEQLHSCESKPNSQSKTLYAVAEDSSHIACFDCDFGIVLYAPAHNSIKAEPWTVWLATGCAWSTMPCRTRDAPGECRCAVPPASCTRGESSSTRTSQSQIHGQKHSMCESSVTEYGEFVREFGFDSHEWGCSYHLNLYPESPDQLSLTPQSHAANR